MEPRKTPSLENVVMSAYRNSSGRNGVGTDPMAAFAAFAGLPNLAGRSQYGHGPSQAAALPMMGGGGKKPEDKDPLAGYPQWYKDWWHAQGQYGGVPPVQGIL